MICPEQSDLKITEYLDPILKAVNERLENFVCVQASSLQIGVSARTPSLKQSLIPCLKTPGSEKIKPNPETNALYPNMEPYSQTTNPKPWILKTCKRAYSVGPGFVTRCASS